MARFRINSDTGVLLHFRHATWYEAQKKAAALMKNRGIPLAGPSQWVEILRPNKGWRRV